MNHLPKKTTPTLLLAGFTFLLFVVVRLVSLNREALGFKPGVASHYLSFNISIFWPACIAVVILNIIIINRIRIYWNDWNDILVKLLILGLTLPTLLLLLQLFS